MNRTKIYILIISLLAISCSPSGEESRPEEAGKVLAEVGDSKFYLTDLEGTMPLYRLNEKDSAATAREVVTEWVRQQLLRERAEVLLENDDPEEIRRKAENYRNQLMVFALQKQYIRTHLDSIIDPTEITAYYDKYSENFLLTENILLLRYAKIELENPKLQTLRQKFGSRSEKDREEVAGICRVYATDSELADTEWISAEKVLSRSPFLLQYDKNQILRKGFKTEISDASYAYFLEIYAVWKAGQIAPEAYARPMIRDLIFNRRKAKLRKQLEDEVFEKASAGSDYELNFD